MLLLGLLLASHRGHTAAIPPLAFSLAVRPPRSLPASLNGFGVWLLLVVGLTIANYGYPIAQFLFFHGSAAPSFAVQNE